VEESRGRAFPGLHGANHFPPHALCEVKMMPDYDRVCPICSMWTFSTKYPHCGVRTVKITAEDYRD